MTALYPLELVITTPYGVVDFGPRIGTPTILKESSLRTTSERITLTGGVVLSFAPNSTGRQLVLSIPEQFAVPLALALPLQQCIKGDVVGMTENLTRRDTQRQWTGLIVTEPNSGDWVMGTPQDGDFFTILMTFRLP